ncbi:MAG TPA: hypothetical protein VMV18_14040, partial [bacterium]|nr:hypothetical protein [bacterium]
MKAWIFMGVSAVAAATLSACNGVTPSAVVTCGSQLQVVAKDASGAQVATTTEFVSYIDNASGGTAAPLSGSTVRVLASAPKDATGALIFSICPG